MLSFTFSSCTSARLLNNVLSCVGLGTAIARTVGHLQKSAEVMKLVNNLMKAPEVAATMREFSKEMVKVTYFLIASKLLIQSSLLLG